MTTKTSDLTAAVAAYLTLTKNGVESGLTVGDSMNSATEISGALPVVRERATAYLVGAFERVADKGDGTARSVIMAAIDAASEDALRESAAEIVAETSALAAEQERIGDVYALAIVENLIARNESSYAGPVEPFELRPLLARLREALS